MATTYEAIATVTVGSGGAANIDFTSIPGTYTDLVVKLSLRQDSSALNYAVMRFNNATTNFTYISIEGTGSAAASFNGSTGTYGFPTPSSATASTFSNAEVYIPNYAGSSNKSFSVDTVTENNGTAAYADLIAGLRSNTDVIDRITFYTAGGSFVQYSTATLYGIKNS